ncbi:MAG: winged helix-turn-helix transcriptional regulator [Treponema sp.]|nr:winged helix-turn-helix transcriptional regulator [Candidatus Treponema equifaecale]
MSDNETKLVLDSLPDEDSLVDISELFKIFGDSTRIKILFSLLNKSLSVNEMVELLGIQQSAISHQLRILKENHLVKYDRMGKSNYYSLSDDHVKSILSMGLEHISE